MPTTTAPSHRSEAREPIPVLWMLAAVLVVLAAIVAVAVSGSQAVRVVAVLVLGLVTLGVIVAVYALLSRTGVRAAPGEHAAATGVPGGPPAGVAIPGGRVAAALVVAVRDAHALAHGTSRFVDGAVAHLPAGDLDATPAGEADAAAVATVRDLLAAQGAQAERCERELARRLADLGHARTRAADDEAAIAEWLYERLLTRGVATDARHAFGLLHLLLATSGLLERLAVAAGDEPTRALAAACHADLAPLAERWTGAWDAVLDADAAVTGRDAGAARTALLDEARSMETMRARLAAVTAAQTREAAAAAGTEQAGAGRLIAAVEQARAAGEAHREPLARLRRGREERRPWLLGWETFAAARATALVDRVRDYKSVRDVRDLLAADELALATYELLARAADRAGDAETAEQARTLREHERAGAGRLEPALAVALEVALLAE